MKSIIIAAYVTICCVPVQVVYQTVVIVYYTTLIPCFFVPVSISIPVSVPVSVQVSLSAY